MRNFNQFCSTNVGSTTKFRIQMTEIGLACSKSAGYKKLLRNFNWYTYRKAYIHTLPTLVYLQDNIYIPCPHWYTYRTTYTYLAHTGVQTLELLILGGHIGVGGFSGEHFHEMRQ